MGEGIFCRLDLSSNRLAINKSYYRVAFTQIRESFVCLQSEFDCTRKYCKILIMWHCHTGE